MEEALRVKKYRRVRERERVIVWGTRFLSHACTWLAQLPPLCSRRGISKQS